MRCQPVHCSPDARVMGVLTCAAGLGCVDVAGTLRCEVPACANGFDDDNDGAIDFPADN